MTRSFDERRSTIVIAELDELLLQYDLISIGTMPMHQLRTLRDRLSEIEGGLSYGRRIAQGRLDILMAEMQRRSDAGEETTEELIGRLPSVLARQSRSESSPRLLRDVDLPEFSAELVGRISMIFDVTDAGRLSQTELSELMTVADRLSDYERDISLKRHEVHRLIDELQEEIITRYRTGAATVDELLVEQP